MAGVGNFLGGLAQGAETGMKIYSAYKGIKRADAAEARMTEAQNNESKMYEEWSAALQESRARRGDRGGSEFGPNQTDDTSQAGVRVDQATVQGAPLVTVPQAGLTPPRQAPQAGYSPTPGSGVGLDTQPLVPMVTRSPKAAVRPPFTSGLGGY